ncbi:rapamycin-insensitive companion of mTOR, partial [Phenoliferia sp. Uapishka_3]
MERTQESYETRLPNGNGHAAEPEQQQSEVDMLRAQLAVETSIADGATNLLHVFDQDPTNDSNVSLRDQVRRELDAATDKIQQLTAKLAQLEPSLPLTPDATQSSFPISVTESPSPLTRSPTQVIISPPPLSPNEPVDTFRPTFELVIGLLQRLDELEEAEKKVKAMDQIVAAVNKLSRVKYELKLEDVLSNIMGCLGDEAGTDVRAAAYRLLRHLIVDQHDVNQLQTRYFDLFLIRTLARDHKFEVEKEQSLRLVRHLLSLPDADRPVQPAVIRAIVALAESQDEKLRLASLQTLGELLLRDVSLLVAAEGLRVVLQALADGPHDLSPHLAMAFLWVADRPDTRQFLRPGLDIEIVLSGFTESQVKGSSQEERVRASAKIIAVFLKSWSGQSRALLDEKEQAKIYSCGSGLLYLNVNGKQALLSLVNSLTNPSSIVRDALLDLFFDIFKLKSPSGNAGSLLNGHSIPANGFKTSSPPPIPTHERLNIVDQYHAMLLLVFIDAGLIDALIAVAAQPKDTSTAKKVTVLIGQVLQLANRVLPPAWATRVQALPRLFSLASSFDTSDARLAASATLSAVDAFNRTHNRLETSPTEDYRPRSNSLDDPLKRGQRQVESTKIRMGMQIDDAHFRNLLLETQVLSTKDHTKWSMEILTELLEGPLLNAKRLDEAMRASKFMRRLLSFFAPLNYRYSDVAKNSQTAKYTQLACTILTTLIANPDGVRYLMEDKLLPQIADCLSQLDPLGNVPAPDIVFSKERMDRFLTSGYFEMMGTLTKSREGVRLLEHFKIFTSFYRISELRSRDDLTKAIIRNVDYALDGHPRVLLSKALTSSYKHVRVFATERLALLTRETEQVEEWQVRLLLTQLYDPSQEVCELAVRVLEDACRTLETLEVVVQMRPSLDHLGDFGDILLTRFLSTSIGVRYLQEIGFIDRELDDWFHERIFTYVVQLELLLASSFETAQPSADRFKVPFDGSPPPHFYGELVKTPEGCEFLEDSGHFVEFAEFIRQHGLEDSDSAIIGKLKSVLWAVGHIGASQGGLAFLDEEYIIECIVEIAEDSLVYSLRGTAFFVLGLIASTVEGSEILEDLGWESVCTPLGVATGICVPIDVASFVFTPPWQMPALEPSESRLVSPPSNHLERDALMAFANLSNHILATKASKALARLKLRHRELFSSPSLYYRVLEMLSTYHYRLAIRRYVLDLFDISLDDRSAQEISAAGEELVARNAEDEDRQTWALPAVASAILDPIDGDFTDDDESSLEEGAAVIPLQVLNPLLVVKGFLISGY